MATDRGSGARRESGMAGMGPSTGKDPGAPGPRRCTMPAMSDIGTITEIEPEDGLGWIELPNGDRVRFGGTACKGFVPAIGMTVRVVATRPGYGGTTKATALEHVSDAPRSFADAPGGPKPRTSLHALQAAGVRAEPLLEGLLARADADDALHRDLAAAGFETGVSGRAGCPNPWFFAVARDSEGNLLGLYAHPMFDAELPWVIWRPERRTLRLLAFDCASFFPSWLAQAEAASVEGAVLARLRRDLRSLGMPEVAAEPFGTGEKVDWLPPDEAERAPLPTYLGATDGGLMERGLIAHAFGVPPDPQAHEALVALYESWGWALPAWS